MVTALFRCDLCSSLYNSPDKAEGCENKGIKKTDISIGDVYCTYIPIRFSNLNKSLTSRTSYVMVIGNNFEKSVGHSYLLDCVFWPRIGEKDKMHIGGRNHLEDSINPEKLNIIGKDEFSRFKDELLWNISKENCNFYDWSLDCGLATIKRGLEKNLFFDLIKEKEREREREKSLLKILERGLKRAVSDEKFEDAAKYRDKINQLLVLKRV